MSLPPSPWLTTHLPSPPAPEDEYEELCSLEHAWTNNSQ